VLVAGKSDFAFSAGYSSEYTLWDAGIYKDDSAPATRLVDENIKNIYSQYEDYTYKIDDQMLILLDSGETAMSYNIVVNINIPSGDETITTGDRFSLIVTY
jgi:hypothetical protein